MGVVNVTPDSFSDGGRFLDPDGRGGARRRACGPGRGHPRRRRRVHPARRRAGGPGRGAAARGPGGAGPGRAPARRHGLGGHHARPRWRGRRWPPAPRVVNDVSALRGGPGAGGRGGPDRGRLLPDAHARRAADDAGRPALRRRGVRGQGLPGGAAGVRGRATGWTSARSGWIRASASARPPATTWSCWPAWTRSWRWAGPWWWARRARRSWAAWPEGAIRATACRARSPPT